MVVAAADSEMDRWIKSSGSLQLRLAAVSWCSSFTGVANERFQHPSLQASIEARSGPLRLMAPDWSSLLRQQKRPDWFDSIGMSLSYAFLFALLARCLTVMTKRRRNRSD